MFTRAAVVGVLIILLAGCTWSAEEPGLFGDRSAPPAAAPRPAESGLPSPGTVDPDLPVLGERIWISGDDQALPFRIAIHGLRRIDGGTVLDWSITPLAQVGLGYGDKIALAPLLDGPADPTRFRLIDRRTRTVHRPVVAKDGDGCLCRVPKDDLRVGVTLLQQVTFGELPERQQTVSVAMPHVALFNNVPVPPPEAVVRATRPVDLSRTPEVAAGIDWTAPFETETGQRMRIGVIAVNATVDSTSVVWTIETLTDGKGIGAPGGPPITDSFDADLGRSTASGLRLEVPGSRKPLTVLRSAAKDTPKNKARCLCTDLGTGWADGMTQEQRSVTVVTNLPPMPLRTLRVDVVLPGLEPIARVEVRYPNDAANYFAGFVTDPAARWGSPTTHQAEAEPIGDWPIALPDEKLLSHFRPVTERMI